MNQYDFLDEPPNPEEIIVYLDKLRGYVMEIYNTIKDRIPKEDYVWILRRCMFINRDILNYVNAIKEGEEVRINHPLPPISTGEPSTLKTYRKIALALGGKNSKAVRFFDLKIAGQGENEPVLADERQMIQLIIQMVVDEQDKK